MTLLKALLCLLLASFGLAAQSPLTWEVGLLPVPSSTTTVQSQTTHVLQLTLVNVTGSAVTVTVNDKSTNCGGSVCTLFAAAIGANTTYTVQLGGVRSIGGVTWIATTPSAVHGWIKGQI